MADKVSTIRFKVEGSQAATDVEKLARTIQAQELRVSRATLKAQTADTLESQQKLFNEKAKMERLYSDVAFAASHTRAEYDLMVFDRTLQAQLAKFRNNEKAYNAIAAQGAIRIPAAFRSRIFFACDRQRGADWRRHRQYCGRRDNGVSEWGGGNWD